MDNSSSIGLNPVLSEYLILARKYRPQTFDDLIGQDLLVRTLRNACKHNRIHHAFMLFGVRGVGKTTTARIIAKSLNCIGQNIHDRLGMQPCIICHNCRAIAEGRHVDVLEMDAASHTGVEDIRQLIENARYRPVVGRYKVYIIDEVHMLSKNAFNALLKTLEEPPQHVKFIFATTEIRKVPTTILSRCQQFNLRRISINLLIKLFEKICYNEKVEAELDALKLIAHAADGSARDGISLLDQAIALNANLITVDEIRYMLGLVDRIQIYEMYRAIMGGKTLNALNILSELYDKGTDPVIIIQELMEVTHIITCMKIAPKGAMNSNLSEVDREEGMALAKVMKMSSLTLAWQMFAKGISEVQASPLAIAAAEMLIIRIAYSAELPDPIDLIRAIRDRKILPADTSCGTTKTHTTLSPAALPSIPIETVDVLDQMPSSIAAGCNRSNFDNLNCEMTQYVENFMSDSSLADLHSDKKILTYNSNKLFDPMPVDFAGVAKLVFQKGEAVLGNTLVTNVHPVVVEPGRLKLRPQGSIDHHHIFKLLTQHLQGWTGQKWVIEISNEKGNPTIMEQNSAQVTAIQTELIGYPLIAKVLELFPGAKIDNMIDFIAPAIVGRDAFVN
ncbi:DNA polymerase III, subunits gamma and tau [Candidatus Endolissoclinum faulkneri L2]|uniref:DNA polymerase III subunit gamma/tau n=1 Tax=Candidatus Endolissoclinum faulkneri L2 TaxID=1193729 RepID=K7YH98_9PROT|nr:DNA polymerase III subunit gamma/tau [Candidatus Endolissoclinum faulkneri]AFX98920.1 DNA polymerase III, subunits gamma and tau [Candidatus Endolissoclinum faulkneri L2]